MNEKNLKRSIMNWLPEAIAVILAIIALVQKQRAAGVALGLSIGLPILGFIISFAVLSAVSY